jgi:hypothetical protein
MAQLTLHSGRAVAQAISRFFPQLQPGFKLRSSHVGFVVNKVALGQVFSEYFGFPCQAFHRLLHTHHHPSSGAGIIGQVVPSGLNLTSPQGHLKPYFIP